MNDWVCFEAAVEPLVWGRATYTILRLPPDVARSFAAVGARRVEGEIAEHPVNLALSRAPAVDGLFLWAGKSLLDRLGAKPGQRLDVRLRAAAQDAVDTPADMQAALRSAGKTDAWQRLTPGKKRGALYQIDTAKTETTRARRIAAIIEGLTE
jgi:acyl transferase domain-containing protein